MNELYKSRCDKNGRWLLSQDHKEPDYVDVVLDSCFGYKASQTSYKRIALEIFLDGRCIVVCRESENDFKNYKEFSMEQSWFNNFYKEEYKPYQNLITFRKISEKYSNTIIKRYTFAFNFHTVIEGKTNGVFISNGKKRPKFLKFDQLLYDYHWPDCSECGILVEHYD